MASYKDITGTRSGLIVAVSFHSMVPNGKTKTALWTCECDCGRAALKKGYQITAGMIRSCGCLHERGNPHRKVKHGHGRRYAQSPEYIAWNAMKNRCYNASHKDYGRYGGRGISVCDRWRSDFRSFLEDMGFKPSPEHTIDRVDNDGDYEPGNCRWATQDEQVNNRSVSVTIEGLTLREIAAAAGLTYACIHGRYYNGARTIADLTVPPNENHLWDSNGRAKDSRP